MRRSGRLEKLLFTLVFLVGAGLVLFNHKSYDAQATLPPTPELGVVTAGVPPAAPQPQSARAAKPQTSTPRPTPVAVAAAATPSPASDYQFEFITVLGPTPEEYRTKVKPETRSFQDTPGGELTARINDVNKALIDTLRHAGVKSDAVHITRTEVKQLPPQTGQDPRDMEYLYRTVDIALPEDVQSYVGLIGEMLHNQFPDASLTEASHNLWYIKFKSNPTHELHFSVLKPITLTAFTPWPAPLLSPKVEGEDKTGRIAIVIDDMGADMRFARNLSNLNMPLTISIIPTLERAKQVAALSQETGMEVMIHHPMQPVSSAIRLDPTALRVGMQEHEIRARIRESIKRIPQAQGLNNHMGSRFSQDSRLTAVLADELSRHRFYLLDSVTHPKSVLAKQAQLHGLQWQRRDFFLDYEANVSTILNQLKKAEETALRVGNSVVIGHPYPETLAALRLWKKDRPKNIHVVHLNTILRAPDNTVRTASAHQ